MMAKQEWGEKRACQSCGKNFYDMMRFPIACPECGAAFTVVETMPRRGPTRAKGKFFPANRPPAEDSVFDSGTVTEDTADDGDGDGDGDGEPVAEGDDAEAGDEDRAA
jgi:hypothetical protein